MSTPPLVRLTLIEEGFVCRCVRLCERSALAAALSGRSPLIGYRRVGRHGCHPWVLKFRAMWDRRHPFRPRAFVCTEYIDDCLGLELKTPDDARISSRFAFCPHSLGELPQLVHVAAGQMSLVGPPVLIEFLAGTIRLYCQESQVRRPPAARKSSPRWAAEATARTAIPRPTCANKRRADLTAQTIQPRVTPK